MRFGHGFVRWLLLFATLPACGDARGAGGLADTPPRPTATEELDPRAVERIETARADVIADSNSASAWGELGMIYEVERFLGLATECYEQAALRAPDDRRWPYRIGLVAQREGDVESARSAFEQVLASEDYAPAHWRLGSLALEGGELDRALRSFQRAAATDPGFPGGWVGEARVHLQRDQSELAIEILERLRPEHPRDPVIARLLVSAYHQKGEVPSDDILATLERGSKQIWDDPWARDVKEFRDQHVMLRLPRMFAEGEYEEIIAVLEAQLEQTPDAIELFPHLGEAYFNLGRIDDAIDAYKRVLRAERDNVQARLSLSRIFESQGETAKAIHHLDQVIALRPDLGTPYQMKGRLLFELNRFEEAVPILRRAFETDQRELEPLLWLAQSELGARDWEAALASFERYLALRPEDSSAELGRAKALLKLRRFDEAERSLALARELGVDRPGYLQQLEDSLRQARERSRLQDEASGQAQDS